MAAGRSAHRSKVVAAMSGGVDSSVAAAILVEEGCEVIGVTMKIGPTDSGPEDFDRTCCSLSAVEDARRVAATLGIPHYVLNFEEVFQREVIDNFIEEYRQGRTPNPCVRCNRFVKFEALLEKARSFGAECVATGHYSRIVFDAEKKRWLLKRGVDHSKDQSYALYGMTQHQLAHVLMPLGNMAKDETRRLASKMGLDVASKPESQEICFVEDKNYGAFLRQVSPEVVRPGPILDTEGNIIGEHQGIAFYTIGQRKGIGIPAPKPLYVVRIDPQRNTITVGCGEDLLGHSLLASDLNYIAIEDLTHPIAVSGKVRYNMKDSPALVAPTGEKQATVTFENPQRAITPGQAVVFYDGESVIGGGIIDRVLHQTS